MSTQAATENGQKSRYRTVKKKSQWKTIWIRFKRNKLAVAGLVVFLIMAVIVLSADLWLDYESGATTMDLANAYQAPSAAHIFGTDQYGRDYFTRVVFGGRISMFVGIATVAVSLTFGGLIGATAAYYGGKVDEVLMRCMDVLMAIPSTLLAITIISALGSSLFNMIIAMGVSQIARMSRIVRSAVMSVKDLVHIKEEEMRSMRGNDISMIFADPMSALNPLHTVGNQIAEVIELHNSNLSHDEIEKKVDEMMELVGIPAERKSEYPHQFSGGMRQRIVIAMALSCNPRLLLADEPTTALDVTIQAQVLKMMDDLKERLNTAMIMITHDLGVVAQICNKVAIIYAGEIVEYGKIEDIYEGEHHHPYTVGLFGSIPDITSTAERLTPIDGLMPDPTKKIPGCRFADRCPHCMEICSKKSPAMANVDGHQIKCFLYLPEGQTGGEGR